jgi:hypothetical protein
LHPGHRGRQVTFDNCARKLNVAVPQVTARYLRFRVSTRTVFGMTKLKPPTSSALLDLEWARVYADRIKGELKLLAKTLSDLNVHGMHPHLAKGATLLKAQMKQASQQVGGMRKIASEFESKWMNTIKRALARSCPDLAERKSTRARPASKKTAMSKARTAHQS